MLKFPLRSALREPLHFPLLTLTGESSTGQDGGFSSGFSGGFDVFLPYAHVAFTSGFSQGFATFSAHKAFSSGFSSGFDIDNR